MLFHLAVISSLVGTAVSMKADSALGRELLSRARRVEQGDAVDYSWVLDYSIQFKGCHTITQYGGGMEDGDDEGAMSTWKQNLVEFKLCPSASCGYGCDGGDYIVNMADFVDLYTEARMAAEELACENLRESCYCDDADDEDQCEYNCYASAGFDYCIAEEEENEFDLQEYLQCQETEDEYGYGNSYYTGLTCSENGQRINLAVFYDNQCSVPGPNEIFTSYKGMSLPYAEETIVNEDCVSCSVNNGDGYELSDFCGTSYGSAAKCETDMSLSNPDYDGCEYINNIYMKEDGYIARKSAVPLICAWVFGVSTVVLAAVAGKMHQNSQANISLNSKDGAVV